MTEDTLEALRAHVIELHRLAVDAAETMAGIVGRGDPKDWACDFSMMEGLHKMIAVTGAARTATTVRELRQAIVLNWHLVQLYIEPGPDVREALVPPLAGAKAK
jgi:hypothetical protein